MHTIEIVGRGSAGISLFLDQFQLASLDAIFNGHIPTFKYTAYPIRPSSIPRRSMRRRFGLHVVAYEGGWALGGDFDALPLENYAKYVDPRAARST